MGSRGNKTRRKAYTVLSIGMVALIPLIMILSVVLPPVIIGVSSNIVAIAIVGIIWIAFFTKYVPRCPKCGLGYFSILEIGKVPIIVTTRFGTKCYGCGANLNDVT